MPHPAQRQGERPEPGAEIRRQRRGFYSAHQCGIELLELPGKRAAGRALRQMRRNPGLRFCRLIVTTIVNYRKRREIYVLYHQERMAAIEKGVELPPIPEDFFKEDSDDAKPSSPHSDFGRALFWLLGGLATLVALYFNFNGKVALYALIPIAIGLHYLIYYYTISRKEAAKGAQVDRVPVS